MSGQPYRFNQEPAQSPLDRTASPFSGAVNFKTNVNRAKTKKWVTAKKNAYDGDDWGEYDEYDEYGVDQEPAQAEPPAAQRHYAQQSQQPSRSFTDPSGPYGQPQKVRRNSFEAGEEHRAFSASTPHPQQQQQQGGYGQQQYGDPQRQTSGSDYGMGVEPQGRRDFTPSAMPPPLQTRVAPGPAPTPIDVHVSPSNPVQAQYPPRKSSIGQSDSPIVASPRTPGGSQSDKPLPFIRPADIYRRVEEERQRERASLESSRPSLDSLSSRPKDELHSPTADGGRSLQPLETVAERKSEYLPDYNVGLPHDGTQQQAQSGFSQQTQQEHPAAVESAFNNEFWSSGLQPQAPATHAPVVSPPTDQGFRSVVDQAFTRSDDSRSIPPTPISKESSNDMSRSNTDSTSGISPIMSRVPSSGASALKRTQAGGEGSTPAIAEEPSDTVSRPTSSSAHPAVPKPFSDHSRNFSNSSLPRSGLATPTRGDSPARSPAVTPRTDLPHSKAAHITTEGLDSPHGMEGGLTGQSPAYATREADIATAMADSSGREVPSLRAAEKQSQDAFLETHSAQSPFEDVLPRSRSESPSKGRVQALAGKFGDVSHSRRGSTQSNLSISSVQSWEKSTDNSRAPSPTKGSPTKPRSPFKEFRPHLPGQWESYAMTPLDHTEQERGMGFGNAKATTSHEAAELTPTTAKRPVSEAEPATTMDPLAALKSAGAAMAQSFRTTVGLDDPAPEPPESDHGKARSYGDVYMPRPLQMERSESALSSVPPTPPAKDTPTSEHPPQLSSQDTNTGTPSNHKRPDFFPQLSTAPSADDQESDRLRKEIVASLTPVRTLEGNANDSDRSALQPAAPGANRASSILPSEYESYWAEGDRSSARMSHDTERNLPTTPTAKDPHSIRSIQPSQPSILNRFSWEGNSPHLGSPDGVSRGITVPEPTKTVHEDKIPSPAIERAAEENQEWSNGTPDTYFGPGHTFTVTKPDPVTTSELTADTPTLQDGYGDQTRSSGLHVVNSAVNPEAVDLPPRLSADLTSKRRTSEDDLRPLQQQLDGETPNPAVSTAIHAPEQHTVASGHGPSTTSPTTDKPLGAREIATISSAAERIATYNKTRDHWATYDHGLKDWLVATLEANPDLTAATNLGQRTSTGTIRHKHAGSLSLLGKFGGSSAHQSQGTEQFQSPSAQSPGSSTAAAPDRRVASAQMQRELQAKGKDLLHTAGVLSGKGVTSAKGLFAKGKSRFGKDKASYSRSNSMPASRQASEEPEQITTPSRTMSTTLGKSYTGSSIDTDSLRDEKKKRRFSIASFSRSRSRPSSIVLPGNASLFSTTPKSTPPRELFRVLGDDRSRPQSYHAPESWIVPDFAQSTPPRENQQQSRLGILPSPAKSAFSTHDQEITQEVPPVPRIPDVYPAQRSNDLSHEMLQSIIRHSTPPVPSSKHDQALRSSSAAPETGWPFQVAGAENFQGTPESNGKPTQLTDVIFDRAPLMDNDHAAPITLALPAELVKNDHDQPTTITVSESQPQEVNPPAAANQEQQFQARSDSPSARREFDQTDEEYNALKASRPSYLGDIDDETPPPHLSNEPFLSTSDFLSQTLRSVNRDETSRFSRHLDPYDDEDDQPPQLNHDPIPPSVRTEENAPAPPAFTPVHLDVSDDEDDQESTPKATIQPGFKPLRDEPIAKNVSPPSLPADVPLDETPNEGRLRKSAHDQHDKRTAYESEAIDSDLWVTAHTKNDATTESKLNKIDVVATQDTEKRPNRKTEVVGAGDLSPVSPRSRKGKDNDDDDDDTPTAGKGEQVHSPASVWFAKSDFKLPSTRYQGAEDLNQSPNQFNIGNSRPTGEARGGALAAPHAALAPPSPQRVSAPFQVVRAVEEYAASDSSFASWDRDSVAANSRPVSSHHADMRDESDVVTPVPQVPRIVQVQPDKAERSSEHSRNAATPNGYFGGHGNASNTMHQPQQPSADLTVPERSKSILSMISSMVSEDGTPLSPASSNAGRSTPSTIRRMHHDPSTSSPLSPARIPEEPTMSYEDRTPTGKDDNYDLYADHNGIIKELRDERGQPMQLQLGGPRISNTAEGSIPNKAGPPSSREGDRPRYSSERPMSFISGPTDQDGRPQDQVNQAAQQAMANMRLAGEQHGGQLHNSNAGPNGMVYSPPPSALIAHQPGSILSERQNPSEAPVRGPMRPYDDVHGGQPVNQRNQATPTQVTPLTNQQTPLTSRAPQQHPASGQQQHNPQDSRNDLRDPRMYGASPGQPRQQGPPGQGQLPRPDQDPRFWSQSNGHPPEPRNDYEFQQRMVALQARYPSYQGASAQSLNSGPQMQTQQIPQQQDKVSSKPKLTSVFKGLGGKLQSNPQAGARPPNAGAPPAAQLPPVNANRIQSYQSAGSNQYREQLTGRPSEQQGPSTPSNRPSSSIAESQFSHGSQGSTRVQATDSRLDLRKPVTPAPYQGPQPQQIQPRMPMQTMQQQPNQQQPQQPPRVPTSVAPETGKKKRFSTLTNFFGRGGDGKKAQKNLRHSSAPPMQSMAPQWQPPQQQMLRAQQPGMAYVPPGQIPPHQAQGMGAMGAQYASPQTMSPATPQSAQSMPPRGPAQQHPQHYQGQQQLPSQPHVPGVPPNHGSAYYTTKQLAEQHQAQRVVAQPDQQTAQAPRSSTQMTRTSFDQNPAQVRQPSYGPPPGGYYDPKSNGKPHEHGVYEKSRVARTLPEQQRQQSTDGNGANGSPPSDRHLPHQPQQPMQNQGVYRASEAERLQMQQQPPRAEYSQGAYGVSQAEHVRSQQPQNQPQLDRQPYAGQIPVGIVNDGRQQSQRPPSAGQGPSSSPQNDRQQTAHPQHQAVRGEEYRMPPPEPSQAHQQRVQPEQYEGGQSYADRVQPLQDRRGVSHSSSHDSIPTQLPVSQRAVSSPIPEPQYPYTPQIPAAYSHVSGAFVSPRDREQQPVFPSGHEPATRPVPNQQIEQRPDPRMEAISPQVSAMSQMPPNTRTHSDASTISVVSPISTVVPDISGTSSPPAPRNQQPRMSSISEVHQGSTDRPWHLNFPEGATEQEIVRAAQRQYMKQQFTTQQQLHAERAAQSPSPRGSGHGGSPIPPSAPDLQPQTQDGGFRELLPRSTPQPVQQASSPQQPEQSRVSHSPQHAQPAPIHPGQGPLPSAYPLPMSPDPTSFSSPVNPVAGRLPPPPPPKEPNSPGHPVLRTAQDRVQDQRPQQAQVPQYEQPQSDESPPSYDGPGVENDGMDKDRSERTRPSNIATGADENVRGQQNESRTRQSSIGILQHPQPASMAASPQASTADMGAESLRRQLLQQDEYTRMERAQRAQIQRAESERERQERETARARARELERSVSGGERVGSLRSVGGSRNGGQPGWERRGSTSRQVFELPAVEDDEPSMKATSYPGQEWVPPMWTDD